MSEKLDANNTGGTKTDAFTFPAGDTIVLWDWVQKMSGRRSASVSQRLDLRKSARWGRSCCYHQPRSPRHPRARFCRPRRPRIQVAENSLHGKQLSIAIKELLNRLTIVEYSQAMGRLMVWAHRKTPDTSSWWPWNYDTRRNWQSQGRLIQGGAQGVPVMDETHPVHCPSIKMFNQLDLPMRKGPTVPIRGRSKGSRRYSSRWHTRRTEWRCVLTSSRARLSSSLDKASNKCKRRTRVLLTPTDAPKGVALQRTGALSKAVHPRETISRPSCPPRDLPRTTQRDWDAEFGGCGGTWDSRTGAKPCHAHCTSGTHKKIEWNGAHGQGRATHGVKEVEDLHKTDKEGVYINDLRGETLNNES